MDLGTLAGAGKTVADLAKDKNITDTGSKLLGMLCPYLGLKKKAVDMYVKEIEESDLPPETKAFTILNTKKTFKKLKNQGKIAEIAVENAKEGTDFSEKSRVDEEWFDRFMDAAGSVSSEDMQLIWGKILAKEFEEPGTTPKSMIRILSEISPECARAFSKIASMKVLFVQMNKNQRIVNPNWIHVIPYNKNKNYMNQLGLNLPMINELETLGLIKFNDISEYNMTTESETEKIFAYLNGKTLLLKDYNKSEISIGDIVFTIAGNALDRITPSDNNEGYEEVFKGYMASKGFVFEDSREYILMVDGNRVRLINLNNLNNLNNINWK